MLQRSPTALAQLKASSVSEFTEQNETNLYFVLSKRNHFITI